MTLYTTRCDMTDEEQEIFLLAEEMGGQMLRARCSLGKVISTSKIQNIICDVKYTYYELFFSIFNRILSNAMCDIA